MSGYRLVVTLSLAAAVGLAATGDVQAQADRDTQRIEPAVAAAVDFLRKNQSGDGTWQYMAVVPEFNIGATALVGLALLESDVDRNDPALRKAANVVRGYAPRLTKVYPVALAILFLDRLDGQGDSELIKTLSLRLAASQDRVTGGWGYECRPLGGSDQTQLLRWLARNRGPYQFKNPVPSEGKDSVGSDNSNTQFAILALWVARRRGLPVDYPLLFAEWRFRTSQAADGGWGYNRDGVATVGSPSMTCAGLLALAVAFGTEKMRQANLRAEGTLDKPGSTRDAPPPAGPPDIRTDAAVLAARNHLARYLGGVGGQPGQPINDLGYFLWSLERVGVTYGFKELGGRDWYAWGTALLLQSQRRDGSWTMNHSPAVDTAFALLFLRKADLLRDLTNDIHGVAQLRSGGSDPIRPPATPRPMDPGPRQVPAEQAEAEARKLLAELPRAKPGRQEEILATLKDTVDGTGHFTNGLLEAITVLRGEMRDRARDALAARLARQSARSLRPKLKDENVELRVAAARAAGQRQETELVPDLIELLKEDNDRLAAAAEEALRAITGKDFGRNADRWREFWQRPKPGG